MSIGDSPYSIDQDWSQTQNNAAPTSGRIGAAPATVQAGRVSLFRNTSGLLSMANVDASGNLTAMGVNPIGQNAQVYAGQPAGAATAQYGHLMMGRQSTPSPVAYQPIALDPHGQLLAAAGTRPSFYAGMSGITAGQGVVLVSLFNASTTCIRITRANIWVQYAGTTTASGGTVLGLTGSSQMGAYYPVYCELTRIGGHSRASATTTLSPAALDTADILDAQVTCFSRSTTTGPATVLHRRDAMQTSMAGRSFYESAQIEGLRQVTCRPGEGVALVCVSNGTIVNFQGQNGVATATIDASLTFTISPS